MAVIAITGDIGAGKSTIAKIMAEKSGAKVFDADKTAKSLWELDNIKLSAAEHWGKNILDSHGNIIKSKISDIIFTDKNEWEFCNNLIHPLVMSKLKSTSLKFENVILEIPLLFEADINANSFSWIDKIIYIAADFEIRAERCKLQRGWSVEELRRREKFLLPRDIKISMSNEVIYNNN